MFCWTGIWANIAGQHALTHLANPALPQQNKSSEPVIASMVKRVGKRAVLSVSKEKMPNLDTDPQKMSFKECKRRSILSGLRMLKAPAVLWPTALGLFRPMKICGVSIET